MRLAVAAAFILLSLRNSDCYVSRECAKGFEAGTFDGLTSCYRFVDYKVSALEESGAGEWDFHEEQCERSAGNLAVRMLPRMTSVHSDAEFSFLFRLFQQSQRAATERHRQCADGFPLGLRARTGRDSLDESSLQWADGSPDVEFIAGALAKSRVPTSRQCFYASPTRGIYADDCILSRDPSERPKCQIVACKYFLQSSKPTATMNENSLLEEQEEFEEEMEDDEQEEDSDADLGEPSRPTLGKVRNEDPDALRGTRSMGKRTRAIDFKVAQNVGPQRAGDSAQARRPMKGSSCRELSTVVASVSVLISVAARRLL